MESGEISFSTVSGAAGKPQIRRDTSVKKRTPVPKDGHQRCQEYPLNLHAGHLGGTSSADPHPLNLSLFFFSTLTCLLIPHIHPTSQCCQLLMVP